MTPNPRTRVDAVREASRRRLGTVQSAGGAVSEIVTRVATRLREAAEAIRRAPGLLAGRQDGGQARNSGPERSARDRSSLQVPAGMAGQVAEACAAAWAGHARPRLHGMTRALFLRVEATAFAERNGADLEVVELAALVYDLRFLPEHGGDRSHEVMTTPRIPVPVAVLTAAGVPAERAQEIGRVVWEAAHRGRRPHVSREAAALSDADTVAWRAPGAVVLAMLEHGRAVRECGGATPELVERVINSCPPSVREGSPFYDSAAEDRYGTSGASGPLWPLVARFLGAALARSRYGTGRRVAPSCGAGL